MTRKRPTSVVPSDDASAYLGQARGFHRTAERMYRSEPNDASTRNSVAVIAVHGAIAYCDALTIRASGRKSKGEHRLAADFLESVLRIHTAEDRKAISALKSLTSKKDEVSYGGEHVTAVEIQQVIRRLTQFADWAERTFSTLK